MSEQELQETERGRSSSPPEGEEPAVEREQSEKSAAAERGSRPWTRRFVLPGVAFLVVTAFVVGLLVGRSDAGGSASAEQSEARHQQDGGVEAANEEVWTCSMHPQVRADQPGQCPICGMDLIRVEEDDGGHDEQAANRVTLTRRAKALARIETETVRRADAGAVELRLLGRVEYDERRIRTVTSWTEGRIDRLRVAVTGQKVGRGQVIATIYSPEIYSAQQDLIQAARQVTRLGDGTPTARSAAESALEATRERLRLLGVPESELRRMESAERPFRQVPIRANFGGTVIERLVDEGAYVNPGTGIYQLADLSRLWVQLDAYERDLSLITEGQPVELMISAFPGETFEGEVAFVDPVLDRRTRTSQVRVEVDNSDGRLQPGMFAEAVVAGGDEEEGALRHLVIPETAPLFTGRRSVVYVEVPDSERPTYEARQVRLGHKRGEVYPVIAGLREGERVVTHGAFTLDADLQIRGGRSMMAQPDDDESGRYDRVVEAAPRFLDALEPVFGAYLNVQERLAEDDHGAATAAMRALAREADAVPRPRSDEARQAWTELSRRLSERATEGAGSDDIEAARVIFEHLSLAMRGLLEQFGNPLESPLRLAYCPMAFDNRGAEWVQRGEEIDNSYFGAVMRRCGEIRETVEPGGHLAAAESDDASSTDDGER